MRILVVPWSHNWPLSHYNFDTIRLHDASGRGCLFFMPLDPLVFLRLPTPFSLSLRLYRQSSEGTRGCPVVFTVATDIPVKSLAVYLILLKSHDAVVELFLALRVDRLVKCLRVSEISGMKQKVGGIINQKFLRRNRLATFKSFTHVSQASTGP